MPFKASGGFLSGADSKLMAGQHVRNLEQRRIELLNMPAYPNKVEDCAIIFFQIAEAKACYVRCLINEIAEEDVIGLSGYITSRESNITWSYAEAYNKDLGTKLYNSGLEDICYGRYANAFSKLTMAATAVPDAYVWLGVMVELGLGCKVN